MRVRARTRGGKEWKGEGGKEKSPERSRESTSARSMGLDAREILYFTGNDRKVYIVPHMDQADCPRISPVMSSKYPDTATLEPGRLQNVGKVRVRKQRGMPPCAAGCDSQGDAQRLQDVWGSISSRNTDAASRFNL